MSTYKFNSPTEKDIAILSINERGVTGEADEALQNFEYFEKTLYKVYRLYRAASGLGLCLHEGLHW
jgi:hypothetical protein